MKKAVTPLMMMLVVLFILYLVVFHPFSERREIVIEMTMTPWYTDTAQADSTAQPLGIDSTQQEAKERSFKPSQ